MLSRAAVLGRAVLGILALQAQTGAGYYPLKFVDQDELRIEHWVRIYIECEMQAARCYPRRGVFESEQRVRWETSAKNGKLAMSKQWMANECAIPPSIAGGRLTIMDSFSIMNLGGKWLLFGRLTGACNAVTVLLTLNLHGRQSSCLNDGFKGSAGVLRYMCVGQCLTTPPSIQHEACLNNASVSAVPESWCMQADTEGGRSGPGCTSRSVLVLAFKLLDKHSGCYWFQFYIVNSLPYHAVNLNPHTMFLRLQEKPHRPSSPAPPVLQVEVRDLDVGDVADGKGISRVYDPRVNLRPPYLRQDRNTLKFAMVDTGRAKDRRIKHSEFENPTNLVLNWAFGKRLASRPHDGQVAECLNNYSKRRKLYGEQPNGEGDAFLRVLNRVAAFESYEHHKNGTWSYGDAEVSFVVQMQAQQPRGQMCSDHGRKRQAVNHAHPRSISFDKRCLAAIAAGVHSVPQIIRSVGLGYHQWNSPSPTPTTLVYARF
ncbi:hypothetical protein C8F01DRAFT_1287060 [Mycena amicta]|nr:hypothetical protein C8F01DRAFT_1287060 [Mycena amicta]